MTKLAILMFGCLIAGSVFAEDVADLVAESVDEIDARQAQAEAMAIALQKALGAAGVTALHLEAASEQAGRIYERAGFHRRALPLMTWIAE